jgi:hypothetical protein
VSRAKVQPEGFHAIFALDPGGTTGVAYGIVELKKTVRSTLAGIDYRHAVEVNGNYRQQAAKLDVLHGVWITDCLRHGIPEERRHVTAEDFVLRMPATTTNLTSIWVVAAFHGVIGLDVEIAYYKADKTKAFGSDDRLRLWGLWERGSAHKRDAWRVFATHLDKVLG